MLAVLLGDGGYGDLLVLGLAGCASWQWWIMLEGGTSPCWLCCWATVDNMTGLLLSMLDVLLGDGGYFAWLVLVPAC